MATKGVIRALVLALALLFSARDALPACDRANFVIAVDIGHTPQTPGATSARGATEYSFNRQLAGRIVSELSRSGFEQIMATNPEEAEIGLLDRSELANRRGADLFLSIHHDSAQPQLLSRWTFDGQSRFFTDKISGHSLFVSDRNGDPAGSLRFAKLLGQQLRDQCLVPTLHHAAPIPGEGRTLLDTRLGIYQFDDLAVLRSTRMPAVLLEAGVIVNRQDELLLRDAARQQSIAEAVARAVNDLVCEPVAQAVRPSPSCP